MQSTKNVTLIGLITAVVLVVTQYLPIASLSVFIIFVLVLTRKQAYSLSIILAILLWMVSGKFLSATNLFLLPLIVYCMKAWQCKWDSKNRSSCLSVNDRRKAISLCLTSFSVILAANIFSEISAATFFSFGIAYVVVSLPICLIGAVGNAIIIGIIGLPTQKRISKVLFKMSM
jgi:hypothetical protein